jgi:DNA invertase Pin-like site-specific DNA recombinase
LLADHDGVYDPSNANDRLLLGRKGAMSEAESQVLRGRLYENLLNEARRGEVFNSTAQGSAVDDATGSLYPTGGRYSPLFAAPQLREAP